MRRGVARVAVLGSAAFGVAPAPAAAPPPGPRCRPPAGDQVVPCRLGIHGTPDLGRAAWRARKGAEVSISVRVDGLAPNPAQGGARRWPLRDSLGSAEGTLADDGRHLTVTVADGRGFAVSSVRVRGRGCIADPAQQRRATLVQIHAAGSPSHGTQGFVALAALDATTGSGRAALAAYRAQHGTGCGPSGTVRGRWRPLVDPDVGATAHARLSSGVVNSVDEYDAKPDFGGAVYLMSNTTSVRVGGIARGVIRVGTPVATVDRLRPCDPNSDGTLTWRYVAVATGFAARPRIFGWIPARCRG